MSFVESFPGLKGQLRFHYLWYLFFNLIVVKDGDLSQELPEGSLFG